MMSAKTVIAEVPTSPTPTASSNAATSAPADGTTSDFQNVLAGAAAPVAEPAPAGAVPIAPLVKLLDLKQQQSLKLAAGAAAGAAVQAARPSTVSPAELLKILNGTAMSLTDTGAGEAVAQQGVPEELRDTEELAKADEDILSEWLDMMLPPSVFAPQAGATNGSAARSSDGSEVEIRQGAAAALPASLALQAGLPGTQESMQPATSAPQGIPLGISREAAAGPAGAQASAAALAAALAAKTETTEIDAPTTESWMSAMGDLTSKRTAGAAPLGESRLSTPVHDARWADALAHRLVLMARDGESVASLKLVPVDLGPLDIQISVRDGEASVHFGAAHQETRAVLESSMPRLRELLSAQGLQLANSSVSHQSAGQNRPERSTAGGGITAVAEDAEVAGAQVISTSLLDIYA